MARVLISGFACLMAGVSWAQDEPTPDSRMVFGGGNEYLTAGTEAMRVGLYDDGIRLTLIGLKGSISTLQRSAALSNLCAAHAAKREADRAIEYCTQSIEIDEHNWRAYSNRSYAYYLKGMDAQAHADLEIAASLSPNSHEIAQIRGMINERNLRPSVIMEDHR